MKLLIVDDNPEIRRIIRHLLQDKFTEIFEGDNGLEAFKIYEKQQPDWVLMDIEMPEVDGLTGLKLIKNKFPNSRVIIVSKYKDEEIVNLSKYAGAEGYFYKDDLTRIVSFFE